MARGSRTHPANKGLVTFPNSMHANTPPGLRTRYASESTAGMSVQFRMPNEMVYRSSEEDGIVEGSD